MALLKKRFDNLDLDHPSVTAVHSRVIRTNPFLRHWYRKQYAKYGALIPGGGAGTHIELGSGGGFIKEELPFVLTSSVLPADKKNRVVDMELNAEKLSLDSGSVDSFFMLDVFHHLKDPESFLRRAEGCLKKGGFIFMVEPASTPFSRLLYKTSHHEAFDEKAAWESEAAGHLSHSNQALAHIVFERDKRLFMEKFPNLELAKVAKHTFSSYILSGGLSYEPLLSVPLAGFKTALIDCFELALSPMMGALGTFMDVLIRRRTAP